MILYQIQLLIWCWVQYLFWQGERNESADYKFSGPSFQTALRQLFISAAKMKFIFYYYQKKKNQKLLSLLQNKNAPKLFIFCLNSNCADFTYLKLFSKRKI